MAMTTDHSLDHFKLEDTRITRRYFGKFERITQHMTKVAATMEAEGRLARRDTDVLARYLLGLNLTFKALAHKYHFSGRYAHAGQLTFDRVESGFPVYQELLEMANDALQAGTHLASMPSVNALKDQMVRTIVGEQANRRSCNMRCRSGCITKSFLKAACFGRAMIRRLFGSRTTMIAAIFRCIGRSMTVR